MVRAESCKIYKYSNSLMCQSVCQLSSKGEETDIQEIGCKVIFIYTIDSDVSILACYFAQILEINMFVQIGSGKNYQVIDIK